MSAHILSRSDRMEQTGKESVHISYEQDIQPYHKETARLICKYTAIGSTVVDIGCGVGHTLSILENMRPDLQLVGIDFDYNCLRITDDRVSNVLTYERDLNRLSFDDINIEFDCVVMSHVLEHTLYPTDIICLVMKKIRNKGFFIMAVPNPVRPLVFVRNIFKYHYANRGHVYSWDRSHWTNFIENILKLNAIEYSQDYVPICPNKFRHYIPNVILNKLESFLAKVFPWWSFSNIVVIHKT